MAKYTTLEHLALSLPEVTIEPHFEKISFRIKKKIFLTYDLKNDRATVKLSEPDQELFSAGTGHCIYPVAGKWGAQGWTFVELDQVGHDLLLEVVTRAYWEVAPKNRSGKP